MKRCPKCNRTFPDETQKFCTFDGGLLITDSRYDNAVTIPGTSSDLGQQSQPYRDAAATSRELPDINQTIAVTANAPTIAFPRNTGPTGVTTSSDLPAPPPRQPEVPLGATTHRPEVKKSKLPLILGAVALVLLLGAGGLVAVFFFVVKPRLAEFQSRPAVVRETAPAAETTPSTTTENANTTTSATQPESHAFVPPTNATKFANSNEKLDGKLAEHYVDFSFYYPNSWEADPKAGVSGASNFVKVEKTQEDPTGEYLLESASVNWYVSNGSFESDIPVFPDRIKSLESQIAGNYPGYEKVTEGETKVNSLPAYEFRFKGVFKDTGKGDLPYWGRVIFVPHGQGEKTGAVITLLATSLAPDLSGVEDIGEKGEMAMILESFRFGKSQ